jgi:PAS domain-containing protein
LFLYGRIRWMLHVETREAHAFHGPDFDSLTELTGLLQHGIDQRAMAEINEVVMNETRQGVVVAGMEGTILSTNKAARRLLGVHGERPQKNFMSDYTAEQDVCAQEVFKGFAATEKRRIELLGEDGQTRPVLATRRILKGSFDTAIWFLVDVKARQWEVDMRFMRETAADIAQQTRAPLALASSLVRQMTALCRGAPASARTSGADLEKRLLAEIGKADITFERLAESIDLRRYPVRTPTSLDLGRLVQRIVDGLPERDRKVIVVPEQAMPYPVNGDTERLGYVMRSLLAYLIRVRSDEGNVQVEIEKNEAQVLLSLMLTDAMSTPAPDWLRRPKDRMGMAVCAAREYASLALKGAKRVIEGHGGTLTVCTRGSAGQDDAPPAWLGFRIALPLTAGDRS